MRSLTLRRARPIEVNRLFKVMLVRMSVRRVRVVRVRAIYTISWNNSIKSYSMKSKVSNTMMYRMSSNDIKRVSC